MGGYASNGTLLDHGWALLEYPNNQCGQFEFNLTLPHETQIELKVACERGEISGDLVSGIWRWRGEAETWTEQHTPASVPVCGFEGMRESIQEFFSVVPAGKLPRANLEVAQRVQHAAQLCADATPEKT